MEAASEINNLYREEHPKAVSKTSSDSGLEALDLGADDFLPIFIFSVIRAEMERPCALSK